MLRLRNDGTVRVTIPCGGSLTEGKKFAERQREWLENQIQKRASSPRQKSRWSIGSEILLRGQLVQIELMEAGKIRVGTEEMNIADAEADLRPAIEAQLRRLAARELPARVWELAKQHQFTVQRVTVRNQRSRWGSCSRRGTISLNWRLIQTPAHVSDYIILHELAHLRHLNHSQHFWQEVEKLCPSYLDAEKWLKIHRGRLI